MIHSRPSARQRVSPTTFRPRLESLEDRSVPATFNVTTTLDVIDLADGKRSLREAVGAANNLAGADTIVLSAGVYKLAIAGAGDNINSSGDLDIIGTVTIRGAGAGLTIIDGQQLDRVFDVAGTAPSSIKVVFEKLTIRNGNVTGPGGGISIGNADLVVRDSIIGGNRASNAGGGISNSAAPGTGNVKLVRSTVARNVSNSFGGGLFVNGASSLSVIDGTIRRNHSASNGGGVFAETATLSGCTVSGNSADGLGGGIAAITASLTSCTVSGNQAGDEGGGIAADTASLTNCTVNDNESNGFGGGISTDSLTVASSTISGNSARLDGGGIFADTATVTGSTISGNSVGSNGGGISATTATIGNCSVSGNTAAAAAGGIDAGIVTVTNSTVSDNSARGIGGGIGSSQATLTNTTITGNSAGTTGGGLSTITATLLNCTIVENMANTGGGVFHISTNPLNVRNSIIALNVVEFGGTDSDVSGAFTSQGHNLIGDGSGSTGFGVNFDIVGTSVNPIDPKLGPLQNNGGKTKTHAPLAGSKAIDAGDNAGLPATDQRGAGFARKKDGNGDGLAIVDIGAFER